MMGSPMVFQTAPPQPASKARMTWCEVLAGGPEASQKGLGERTPQKVTLKSGISPPFVRGLQHLMNAERSSLAVGDGVHHFAAAVHAVATGEVTRIGGTHG